MRWSPAALLLAACTPDAVVPEDCVPIAMAGADLAAAVGDDVILDGSASSTCGDSPIAYGWSLVRRPEGSVLDDSAFADNGTPAAIATAFVPDVPGTWVVALVVSQGGVPSNADVVVIEVGATDGAPVADAGADRAGRVGERAILDGSGSTDPDGDALAFRWTIASAPEDSQLAPGDLWDPHTSAPSFVPDVAGTYVAALIVDDERHASAPDYTSVTAAPDDRAPVADAGLSETLPACASALFTLDGTGSYDPDGDEVSYQWGILAVPAGSTASDADLSDATAARPSFPPDVDGAYTFWLEVDDGVLPSPKDLVTLTTSPASSNRAPVANASADQTISVHARCEGGLDGPVCAPCPTVRFRLDGTGSTDADGDPLAMSWTIPDDLDVADPRVGAIEVFTPDDLVPAAGAELVTTWELRLSVADCVATADDVVRITLACQGGSP